MYESDFYSEQEHGSRISAEIILPPIFQALHPKTVIDVGCGVGTWLKVAKKLGAASVGLEGAWVQNVRANPDIIIADLEAPISAKGRFDLAMCLEVGEHLSKERGPPLVRELCSLSDYVLFSAAVPGQTGTNHINEQWQSWWQNLFGQNDFVLVDCVRPNIWKNRAVEWWYRQNIFLYVRKSKYDGLMLPKQSPLPVDVVHPHRRRFSARQAFGLVIPKRLKWQIKKLEREIRLRYQR